MATIQVRVDDTTKTAADSLFASLGLDTSTAMRMFLASALEHDGLPFPVKRNRGHGKPNAELREALEDVRLQRNLHGPFDTVDDAMKALLED